MAYNVWQCWMYNVSTRDEQKVLITAPAAWEHQKLNDLFHAHAATNGLIINNTEGAVKCLGDSLLYVWVK